MEVMKKDILNKLDEMINSIIEESLSFNLSKLIEEINGPNRYDENLLKLRQILANVYFSENEKYYDKIKKNIKEKQLINIKKEIDNLLIKHNLPINCEIEDENLLIFYYESIPLCNIDLSSRRFNIYPLKTIINYSSPIEEHIYCLFRQKREWYHPIYCKPYVKEKKITPFFEISYTMFGNIDMKHMNVYQHYLKELRKKIDDLKKDIKKYQSILNNLVPLSDYFNNPYLKVVSKTIYKKDYYNIIKQLNEESLRNLLIYKEAEETLVNMIKDIETEELNITFNKKIYILEKLIEILDIKRI